MASVIRIKPSSHEILQQIARLTGRSLQDELEEAVEEHRRRIYLQGVAADYAALRKDPKALADWQKELAEWETVNTDGLKGG